MAKKSTKHELTEKEIQRTERIERETAYLLDDGYVRKDHIISIDYANIVALVLFIASAVIFGVWFYFKNKKIYDFDFKSLIIFLAAMVILTVVHELIHGLFWGSFAKKHFKSVEFGIMKGSFTPYCTCLEPLAKSQYVIGALMPGVVLGLIPTVISIFIGSCVWFWVGIVMISGAGGDLTIIIKMLTYKTDAKDVILLDHPSECGFISFER